MGLSNKQITFCLAIGVLVVGVLLFAIGYTVGETKVRATREYQLGNQLYNRIEEAEKQMDKAASESNSIHAQVETGF